MTAVHDPPQQGFGVIGMGAYLPGDPIDNSALAGPMGVPPAWIEERTGVRTRHRALPGQTTADLAVAAAAAALEDAGARADGDELDLVVMATSTPDRQVPQPVCDLHHGLGLPIMPTLSLDGGCAGFAQAVLTAEAFHAAGRCTRALVVGANRQELFLDPTDRRIAALFGDGAGAFVLGPVPPGFGILGSTMLTDTSHIDVLNTPMRTLDSAHPEPLHMDGRKLIEIFVDALPVMLEMALDDAGLTIGDVDLLLLHQANARLVHEFARHLGLPLDAVPASGTQVGNLAAASLPTAAVRRHNERPVRTGDVVVFLTAGAGVTGAAIVMRWV